MLLKMVRISSLYFILEMTPYCPCISLSNVEYRWYYPTSGHWILIHAVGSILSQPSLPS